MAAVAGPAPYSSSYSDWLSSKKAADVAPQGYKSRDARGRFKKPESQILVDSADGNTYAVGGQQSLDDLLMFAAHTPEFTGKYKGSGRLRDTGSAADFIDFAFNKSRSKKNVGVDCPEGCHIQRIEYAGQYQLMKVTFATNGTVIVYTRVPSYVFEKLRMEAETGGKTTDTVDGKERHTVGVEFWNFVRIRGTVHGSRYPAFYESNMNPGTRTSGGAYGYFAEAKSAKARKTDDLSDGKGGVLSDADMKELEGNLYKPLEFAYKKRRLTERELADFRRLAGNLANMEGTVSFELSHGSEETRLQRAQERAEKMVHDFLELPRISKSLKEQLKLLGARRSTDDDGEGLIRQEKFLVGLNMWPR